MGHACEPEKEGNSGAGLWDTHKCHSGRASIEVYAEKSREVKSQDEPGVLRALNSADDRVMGSDLDSVPTERFAKPLLLDGMMGTGLGQRLCATSSHARVYSINYIFLERRASSFKSERLYIAHR